MSHDRTEVSKINTTYWEHAVTRLLAERVLKQRVKIRKKNVEFLSNILNEDVLWLTVIQFTISGICNRNQGFC